MTIDEPFNEDEAKGILNEIIIQENLQNPELKFQSVSKMGEGYLGITKAVEIKSADKILKLFIKAAPKDQKLRDGLKSKLVFSKEIYFYSEVLPIYDEFLQKRIKQSLNVTAKCYATKAEEFKEVLVFDNLKEQGYESHDRKTIIDKEHILLVLKTYAKFHGTSYALKDQCPDLFMKLSKNLTDEMVMIFSHFNTEKAMFDNAKILKDNLSGKIDNIALDILDKAIGEFLQFVKTSNGDEGIILHGDCWTSNMLFKYEENSKAPTDLKLLDFQIGRVNLPVFDLSYFFYCSAPLPEHLDNIDYYLDYYYNNLSDFTKQLGSDIHQIYPYDKFKEHWKKYCRFGLLLCLVAQKILLAEENETINIAAGIKESDDFVFNVNISNVDTYVERIENVILHFVNKEFLQYMVGFCSFISY